MNVWLLTNTPSPYQVELLSAIERDNRCRLDVRFMRQVHRGATWQPGPTPPFAFRVLGGIGPSWWSDAFRLHPRALAECLFGRQDLFVLSGQYTSFTFAACALALTMRRKPWAMWLEQPWPEDYRPAWTRSVSARSGIVRTIRERFLASLLRHTRRVFCIGTAAVEAYRRQGADPAKLACMPYCCDTSRYAQADEAAVRSVRARYALDGKTVFLFSGQLIERKGVDVLLRAFAELTASRSDMALLLLGDGPLRQSLEASVPAFCRHLVHFAGHVEQADLPAHFHAADVFVLPSRHDGWGVVVNEACAAGLPVIVTAAAGASRDLVADGRNGFIVPRDDVAALRGRMLHFLEKPADIRQYGGQSKQIVAALSLENAARTFCENARLASGESST